MSNSTFQLGTDAGIRVLTRPNASALDLSSARPALSPPRCKASRLARHRALGRLLLVGGVVEGLSPDLTLPCLSGAFEAAVSRGMGVVCVRLPAGETPAGAATLREFVDRLKSVCSYCRVYQFAESGPQPVGSRLHGWFPRDGWGYGVNLIRSGLC